MAQDLAEAGHRPGGGRGSVAITVTTSGPGGPEAFVIQRSSTGLRVAGGGAVGAMYGLIEIGEQAAENQGQGLLQAVRPTIRRPYLSLRADSPTLWLGAKGELPELLRDPGFWKRYLAALAHGRFNLLHLHGFMDPATGRPRSLLERLMPAGGGPDTEARHFLSDLKTLAGLCRDRGIRLGLTDDAASEAPAAAASAHRLISAVPGLWGLGARLTAPGAGRLAPAVAEAVAPRSFLAELEPASPDQLSLQMVSIPPLLPASARLILPVNGGTFALPYPLLDPDVGRPEDEGESQRGEPAARTVLLPASHYPLPSPLLWDVPAGRIAPALPWCDPDFIRRLVRSIPMLSPSADRAGGLLIEPPESFFASLRVQSSGVQAFRRSGVQAFSVDMDGPTPAPVGPERPNARTPERPKAFPPAWWWHHTWGRLTYDPSEPDSRLQAAFQRRYGKEPGWHIERVLAGASTVVPLLAAVDATAPAAGGDRVPERAPGTLEEWEASPWLDAHALVDIPTWATRRLEGKGDARLDPAQLTFQLAHTAMRVRNEVDTVEILHPRRLAEWHELRRQIEALCHLADFGARRISAAAHLELHRRTGDEMELLLASGDATLAQISWEAMQRMLAPGGEREMGHMTMPSQPPAPWGPFASDAAVISRLQSELAQALALPRPAPRIAHVPIQRATPTRAQRIAATVMSAPNPPVVTLAYRLVDRAGNTGPERDRAMTRLFETQAFYQAEIQGPELTEGFLEYQIRATGGFGATAVWPAPDQWRRVPVTRDEAGPAIRPLSPVVSSGSALLACEVADPSGVRRVRLLLRPLTPREPWQAREMTLAGTRAAVEVPLPREGLQYSFEAADTWGNRAMAPDVTAAAPYFVLLSGAAAPGPVARSARIRPGH